MHRQPRVGIAAENARYFEALFRESVKRLAVLWLTNASKPTVKKTVVIRPRDSFPVDICTRLLRIGVTTLRYNGSAVAALFSQDTRNGMRPIGAEVRASCEPPRGSSRGSYISRYPTKTDDKINLG